MRVHVGYLKFFKNSARCENVVREVLLNVKYVAQYRSLVFNYNLGSRRSTCLGEIAIVILNVFITKCNVYNFAKITTVLSGKATILHNM